MVGPGTGGAVAVAVLTLSLACAGVGGCHDEPAPPIPPTSSCNGGGIFTEKETSSSFDSIGLFGEVTLGNCTDGPGPATVEVLDVTTGRRGTGSASARCAAFFRVFTVRADAPLAPGANVIEVHVSAGDYRACDTVRVDCAPCTPPPPAPDAAVADAAVPDAAPPDAAP
jgi:hypothetical protein